METNANTPAERSREMIGLSDETSVLKGQPLAYYEALITQTEDWEKTQLLCLEAIYEGELYTKVCPLFSGYLQLRLDVKKSRAYQLQHFLRVRKIRRAQGLPLPANEREARQFARDGTPLSKPATATSYERQVRRTQRYLAASWSKLAPGEHQRWLQDMRLALDHFERDQGVQLPEPPNTSPTADTASKDPTAPVDGDHPITNQAGGTPSLSIPSAHNAEPSTPVIEQANVAPAEGGTVNELPAVPEVAHLFGNRVTLVVNSGPVQGMSIEEARKLGLLKPARRK